MELYTETTDGSTIEDKETALVWSYEDADPDFGSCQAKELLDHLESVLANEPVTVKRGQNYVEVKPQVCLIVQSPEKNQIAFVSTCNITSLLALLSCYNAGREQRTYSEKDSFNDARKRNTS